MVSVLLLGKEVSVRLFGGARYFWARRCLSGCLEEPVPSGLCEIVWRSQFQVVSVFHPVLEDIRALQCGVSSL